MNLIDHAVRGSQFDAVMGTTPVPVREPDSIHSTITNLYSEIEQAAKAVAVLRDKLATALRPEVNAMIGTIASDNDLESRSDIEKRIEFARIELRGLSDEVFALVRRIAL